MGKASDRNSALPPRGTVVNLEFPEDRALGDGEAIREIRQMPLGAWATVVFLRCVTVVLASLMVISVLAGGLLAIGSGLIEAPFRELFVVILVSAAFWLIPNLLFAMAGAATLIADSTRDLHLLNSNRHRAWVQDWLAGLVIVGKWTAFGFVAIQAVSCTVAGIGTGFSGVRGGVLLCDLLILVGLIIIRRLSIPRDA